MKHTVRVPWLGGGLAGPGWTTQCRIIALSLCEEILAFSHAFGSLAVRRVAL